MNEFEKLYNRGGYKLSDFERDEYWARVINQARVVNSLGVNLRVLDVGCGKGEVSRLLRSEFYIDGLDLSLTALKEASHFVNTVTVGDVFKLPFIDNQFDLVIMFETLYHSGLPEYSKTIQAFREIARVLKIRGKFILVNALANDPILFLSEAKRTLYRKIPLRILAFIRKITHRPKSICFPRYVLTTGEIRRRLVSSGFEVKAFYPYFFYLPIFLHNKQWLGVMFRLGKIFPQICRYGMFISSKQEEE